MLSAFGNQNMPPLMSPESQDPGMLRTGLANMKQGMSGAKGGVMQAMLQQSLSKLGKGMFQAEPMQHSPTQLDPYGNPIG